MKQQLTTARKHIQIIWFKYGQKAIDSHDFTYFAILKDIYLMDLTEPFYLIMNNIIMLKINYETYRRSAQKLRAEHKEGYENHPREKCGNECWRYSEDVKEITDINNAIFKEYFGGKK